MKKRKDSITKAILRKSLLSIILGIFLVLAIVAVWKKDNIVGLLQMLRGDITNRNGDAGQIELVTKPTGTLPNGEGYIICESIIQGVARIDLPNGKYTLRVITKTPTGEWDIIEYPIELINFKNDVTYSLSTGQSSRTVNLGSSEVDQRMLVVKYWGDLTVNKGVTLTATTRKKGMYVHVNGTTTNNGTITMTAKGSYADPENVYLYQNEDKTNEYVPAYGASGLLAKNVKSPNSQGEKGTNGKDRQTGAGGRGAFIGLNYDKNLALAQTGSGTSYSGGSGTGAIMATDGTPNSYTGQWHYQPGVNGLNGGDGSYYETSSATKVIAGGGAGIQQGTIAKYRTNATLLNNGNGTGGLLVLYSNNLSGNGKISSEGVSAPNYMWNDANDKWNFQGAGGSSGGGSVNIFVDNEYNFEGTTSAVGGESRLFSTNSAVSANMRGGAGGDGTVTIFNKHMNFQENKNLELDFYEGLDKENYSKTYNYTGTVQEFIAPITAYYTIEANGAAGGGGMKSGAIYHDGGKGAKTTGTIGLKKGQRLYIYVGGKGQNAIENGKAAGGWNGGGNGDHDYADDESAGGGGGATDIRLVDGNWNNVTSLRSRIMVAAGGGGGADVFAGLDAGTLTSSGGRYGTGSTQTSGYAFGKGQDGYYVFHNNATAGGRRWLLWRCSKQQRRK